MAISAVLLAAMLAGPGGSAQAKLFYEEIFVCTLEEGETMEKVMEISAEWQRSVRELRGGETVTVRVGRPLYSDDLLSFTWATTVADRTGIGTYMDSYPEKMEAIDREFYAIADCRSSSFWEMAEFK